MEEQLRSLLLVDSGVSSHVSDRVNFGAHPQGQPFPAIVLNTISESEGYTLNGPNGVTHTRIQVDCYAGTYGAAKLLSRAVRSLLSGYQGGAFQGVFLVGTRGGREGGSNEAERPYRVSMDFMVHFTTT
ncbi:hypothetical protein JI58_07945 [Marinosulfonomonas sp. PRT-SC04]|nr:hypothetical protein JI58_07945 [Marinosulfonomonas sp. PRT-SC04]